MQKIQLNQPGREESLRSVSVGCVGSGDLEVMIEPTCESSASICIKTSVDGSEVRWHQIMDAINADLELPAMQMDIHDFGATPGVVRLRVEQALELARENRGAA